MRFHSLTTRFVLTLLLTTAVPFLGFAWFVRGGMEARLDEQVVRVLLTDQSALLAERIEAIVRELYQDCALLEKAAKSALDADDEGLFQLEFDELIPDAHERIRMALVVDRDGRPLYRVESSSMDPTSTAARLALMPDSFADAPWFKATAVEGNGLCWVDRHLSSLFHHNPDDVRLDPRQYTFGLAFLLPDDFGGSRGAVYALFEWHSIQEVVDSVATTLREAADFSSAGCYVWSADGGVLASADRADFVDGSMSGELRAVVSGLDEERVHRLDEGTRLVGLSPVDSLTGFGWRCGVTVTAEEAFATSRNFSRLTVIVTASIAVILLFWSLFASRAILRPVRTLADATGRISDGDLSTRVDVRGRDELADLGRSFNHMAEELSDNREQLRVAEREAAWAEMARQVAHEIKNPLTPMRMSAQLLQRARRNDDPRLPELVDRLTRTVVEQTEQLARIASDFRQFAGRPDRDPEPTTTAELMESVRSDFAAQLESETSHLCIREGGPEVVSVDRGELRRVFINLIQNALEASGPGGEVEAGVESGADRVQFFVRDNGPGVPPEVVDHLFEPYFTTRSSGTGLGLAICRRILEAHGGHIELASGEPGQTTFAFDLPIQA